jgi:hypothetical protein
VNNEQKKNKVMDLREVLIVIFLVKIEQPHWVVH